MTSDNLDPTPAGAGIPCPVCQKPLSLGPARGRKSGKPFVMVRCRQDGRHFRGFISDRDFVQRTLDAAEGLGHEAAEGKGS